MSHENFPQPKPEGLDRVNAWRRQSPMAGWLNFNTTFEGDHFEYRLSFAERHIGNGVNRMLHGGVVSTFLQTCAQTEALACLDDTIRAKVISVHCNYLRPALAQDMIGRVTIMNRGRRVAFLDAVCWQKEESALVARAAVALRLMNNEK